MTTTATRRAALACALLATTSLASPALAQMTEVPPPPVDRNIDENGVDLSSGELVPPAMNVSIGDAANALAYVQTLDGNTWRSNFSMRVAETASGSATVTLGDQSRIFSKSGSTYTSTHGDGATLVLDTTANAYVYRDRHGTSISFDRNISGTGAYALATSVTTPNGLKTTLHYRTDTLMTCNPLIGCISFPISRIQSVTRNDGFQLKLAYASNAAIDQFNIEDWQRVTSVTAINNTVDYCSPTADSCTGLTQSWPSLAIGKAQSGSTITYTATDSASRTARYSLTAGANGAYRVTAVRRPSSASDTTTISYDTNGRVASLTKDGLTWIYAFSDSGNQRTATITTPDANTRKVYSFIDVRQVFNYTDELNRSTTYFRDTQGRPTSIYFHGGTALHYEYDTRGNLKKVRRAPRVGQGLPELVTTATFPTSCANPVICNKPTSTADAAGNVTEYGYDPTHGGVLTVTAPAPAVDATRPEVRYSYSLRSAYFKDANGSIVAAAPIWMPTETSACRTLASCAGGADEVKTVVSYGSQTAGVANNLLVSSVSTGSGDGVLTATSAFTHDLVGNLLTVDGPLAGTADTTRYRYNVVRELVGVTGPDPDGAGVALHRAQRFSYNPDGQITKVEHGAVYSQSDASWNAFASFQAAETDYDANARPVTNKLTADGTTYSLIQMSYDAKGRPECLAVRMNPAEFGSLPASACTLDLEGSYGPDRITKTHYDAADQVTKVQVALGTTAQADEATMTYTANGKLETLTDGEGNKTTYEYDPYDRLLNTLYPHPTAKGTSSTTDFEQLSYDSRENITTRRLRDEQEINYNYDNLSRLTNKDVPNSAYYENDVDYSYDLLGRLTSASSGGTSQSVAFGYDALGRVTGETSLYGAKAMQYDLAGRLTRLTWPDSFYVTYDYNTVGDMTEIKESGTVSLATFGYDNLGRRVWLVRGNGTSTNYGYDGASRLTSLSFDLGGTAYDQSVTLAYNPASQIVSRTGTNDAYAFSGHSNVNLTDTVNGLNQIVTTDSASITHDARGNTTGIGSTSYGYTSENRMTNGAGTWFVYDALGRMTDIYPSPTTEARIDNLGSQIISELDNSNVITRRFVHGPGMDEPLVEFSGTSLATKRYLHADERGSIVGWTDAAGTSIQTNRYDEHGMPQSGFSGRFGYTGQAWIPEVGLSYYKARMYHPELGRFMQADPIGYAAGMNLYDYVQGDPVNLVDPDGLKPSDVLTGTRIPYQDSSRTCAACSVSFSRVVATRDVTDYSINGVHVGTFVGEWRAVGSNAWSGGHGAGHQNTDPGSPFSLPTYEDENGDIVVTATKMVPDSQRWVLVGGRYYANPNYERPWWDLGLEGAIAAGPVLGAAGAAAAALPALPTAMATSRTFGLQSSRFGNSFYRGRAGMAGQGSWNHGSFRIGWSYNSRTGTVYFQPRFGNYHVPSPIFIPAP